MRDQMAILFDRAGYTRDSHPAIIAANDVSSLESLLIYTLGELIELSAEHERLLIASDAAGEKLQPSKQWWLEFADFIVMLKIINDRTGSKFSVEETSFSVNGQFKGSFDSLAEQTVNLAEGDVGRNFDFLFTELMSLVRHLNVDLQGELYARLINAKLFLNREMRFFKIEKGMNELDVINKNNHVFKALRLLRSFLMEATGEEMTLQPWITDFFQDEISDWRNSDFALESLRKKIAIFKIKIKDELAWSLTGRNTGDEFLEMKMMIAGAKLIAVNTSDEQSTLQSRSANATLGTTVFWT